MLSRPRQGSNNSRTTWPRRSPTSLRLSDSSGKRSGSRPLIAGESGSELTKNLDPELIAFLEEQLKQETIRRGDRLQQEIERQAAHALGRAFHEVETSDKLLQVTSRLRAASEKRLEAQRALYTEGRIPVDRYLDAVSTASTAAAQEQHARAGYHLSVTKLEEAKGTLLASLGIEVHDAVRSRTSSGRESAVKAATLKLDTAPSARP